jgi:competence protein ComEC
VAAFARADAVASVGILPALALVAGAVCAFVTDRVPGMGGVPLACALAGWIGWFCHRPRLTMVCVAAGFFCASAALGVEARGAAFDAPLRVALERAFGGFDLWSIGPGARHDPISVRATLVEDAAPEDGFVGLRGRVAAIRLDGRWTPARGGVTFAVTGAEAASRIDHWRAGRVLELVATFRRPTRYLNDGVPDVERQLALDGTTLFGSVKSGLLVDVIGRGNRIQEASAEIRAQVRRRIGRWVATHDAVSAAIVTAVLIGDRTGLPDPIRLRLQSAGTYHVIAISGGNIAILAALIVGALLLCGIAGRVAAWITLLLLVGYAQIVTAGPSVWRATVMAVLYLAARSLDHRSPPWQAMAMAAAVVVCIRPLDVRDAGFLLTFGATAALIHVARRLSNTGRHRGVAVWVTASIAASLAVELALLPVNASIFSRITGAGLVLNLLAVPVMGLVQVGGMAVVVLDGIDALAALAGWVAHAAATILVASARIVEAAPWLVVRVPAPPAALVLLYYGALAATLGARGRLRAGAAAVLAIASAAIVSGQPAAWVNRDHSAGSLHITTFDVGQGDSTLVEFPDRSTLLVDTGGIPFGGGTFDIGARVLAPALWARGVRRLDSLLLTHGDPDHIGGARTVIAEFAPARVWEGIPVARHAGLSAVLAQAREAGARIEQTLAGDATAVGGVRVRVLHPPAPDWERLRVRNDDSVVLELIYGDVAVLLLGDVGTAVERQLVDQLTPARVRVLKVAHHGSRTSTSRELLDRWRPQIAMISAGRGNTFGHPAPEVLQRLEVAGAVVYRTDLDGQISLDTNGRELQVSTYTGRRE